MDSRFVPIDYTQMELRLYHEITKQYLPWYKRIYYRLLRRLLPRNAFYRVMYGGNLFHHVHL